MCSASRSQCARIRTTSSSMFRSLERWATSRSLASFAAMSVTLPRAESSERITVLSSIPADVNNDVTDVVSCPSDSQDGYDREHDQPHLRSPSPVAPAEPLPLGEFAEDEHRENELREVDQSHENRGQLHLVRHPTPLRSASPKCPLEWTPGLKFHAPC